MDKRILLTLALGAMSQVFTHAWEPKGDKIKTVWAEQVMPVSYTHLTLPTNSLV